MKNDSHVCIVYRISKRRREEKCFFPKLSLTKVALSILAKFAWEQNF